MNVARLCVWWRATGSRACCLLLPGWPAFLPASVPKRHEAARARRTLCRRHPVKRAHHQLRKSAFSVCFVADATCYGLFPEVLPLWRCLAHASLSRLRLSRVLVVRVGHDILLHETRMFHAAFLRHRAISTFYSLTVLDCGFLSPFQVLVQNVLVCPYTAKRPHTLGS